MFLKPNLKTKSHIYQYFIIYKEFWMLPVCLGGFHIYWARPEFFQNLNGLRCWILTHGYCIFLASHNKYV